MISGAHTITVKIGSALLVDPETGGIRTDWLAALAEDVAGLRADGKRVVLVSSGAIALGRGVLCLPRTDLALEQAQAAAAAGQIVLARAYSEALAPHGIAAAQVLRCPSSTRTTRSPPTKSAMATTTASRRGWR